MVGPCLHTLPACPACTPCLHAGSCPLPQHGEQVPCGQGSHRRRCYPTAGCVAGQATASRAAQPPPLPITRPWCHAPPRPPARPQQLPPPAAPMRACRLSAQPIPLAVPLPVAPWWSPRFPRRRDCACSLRGCATAVVPVAVPRCRSFGKADPSPRCLARGGASVFGTLGARLTPPPPPPDPLWPRPRRTPPSVPGVRGTPAPLHSPKPPPDSSASSLQPMWLGHAGAARGLGQGTQRGVRAAQRAGRVPQHPIAAAAAAAAATGRARRVVSEHQPSPHRLLHPTAAGGNAFLEVSPGGVKPHDGSAGRGRDLRRLAAGRPAAALPLPLARTHRGWDGVRGAVLICPPRAPSPPQILGHRGWSHPQTHCGACPGRGPSAMPRAHPSAAQP